VDVEKAKNIFTEFKIVANKVRQNRFYQATLGFDKK
jgi:hypothetical protein